MIDAGAVFAADGPLARALPGFGPRPQQIRMAEEVGTALAAGRHLVVEAGTGVGKSLAYLVPAVLWTAGTGAGEPPRRVIVSTFTRALQEQLARKDLPLLERALAPLGIGVRHALLMGSENYLCVQRLDLLARAPRPPHGTEGAEIVTALVRHAESALSGLRSEIPLPVPDDLWAAVRRDSDTCLGPRGPHWDACLYRRDLVRAREAEIVVVNHALFFLDLVLGGRILPPHDAVVLDEAHRAEEAAAAVFGATLGPASVARLLRDIAPAARGARRTRRTRRDDGGRDLVVRAAAAAVEDAAGAFFTEVARVAADLAARRGRGTRPGPEDTVSRATGPASVRLPPGALGDERLRAPLADLAIALEERGRAAAEPGDAAGLLALALRARDLGDRAALFLAQKRDDLVYWAETGAGRDGGATLRAAPVEVGPALRTRLFESGRTVILTSATLAAAGSFAHVRHRLGLTAASETALGSPFDYERQALLYEPDRMPDPSAEPHDYARAVADQCGALVEASDGGALVLFTSYALLRRVHEAIRPLTERLGLALHRHAPDGTATTLLEEFRAGRRGVLLGAMTFWQGVDVPGEALRLVIITRLPFDLPDHPVAEARNEAIRGRGGDPFLEDSLPEAILTFRQGFGRLIRSHDDRGVVAVLDPRLRTRGYGAAFLEALPPSRRTNSIEEVARFVGPSRA